MTDVSRNYIDYDYVIGHLSLYMYISGYENYSNIKTITHRNLFDFPEFMKCHTVFCVNKRLVFVVLT